MLVLSRYKDESVVLTTTEGRITVTIIGVRGDKVRLGFEAPKAIPVHRGEIQYAIDQEKEERRQNATESDNTNIIS